MTTLTSSARSVGRTMRRDRWWVQPAFVVTALTLFGIYSIAVAAMNKDFLYLKHGAKLLSPFYSPDLSELLRWHNGRIPYAFLVLWAPLGMRTTCYYYRKSYYRAFFLAPPSCAVAGFARRKYTGETRVPFLLNNLHRFFFYLAAVVVWFLAYDTGRAFIYKTATGTRLGVSVGAFIMLLNVILLAGFTFGCNSFRHLVGGKLNCFSCSAPARTRLLAWRKVSILNGHHQFWAWASMCSVGLTDLYIRLAASGLFADPHHIF